MRAPTISETMFGGEHPGGAIPFLPNFIPNPDLRPEVQKGWEFGANIKQNGLFTRGDVFRLKAAYYRMNVEDYIQGYQFFTFPGPVVNSSFRNVPGTSHVQGIELEGLYDAGSVFAGLSYTFTDSALPTQLSGTGAPSVPARAHSGRDGRRASARPEADHRRPGVVLFLSSMSVPRTPELQPGLSPTRTRTLPGYTLVDLFTSYKLTNFGARSIRRRTSSMQTILRADHADPSVRPGHAGKLLRQQLPSCSDYGPRPHLSVHRQGPLLMPRMRGLPCTKHEKVSRQYAGRAPRLPGAGCGAAG